MPAVQVVSLLAQHTGLRCRLLASVDHAVSDDRTIVLVPVIAVGISVHRQHRFHSVRHIRQLLCIPHTISVLGKSRFQLTDISHIDVRQHIRCLSPIF